VARVEISINDGATWTTLASYSGGYSPGLTGVEVEAPEWTTLNWQPVQLDLSQYTGTIRLRFSLEVDQPGADKGWVVDNVLVRPAAALNQAVFLPLIVK
jgi:hypothetical protein